MKLWEGLEQDLNYNAMVTQRGVSQSLFTRMPSATPMRPPRQRDAPAWRRCGTARCGGGERRMPPLPDFRQRAAFRSMAASLQRARRHGARTTRSSGDMPAARLTVGVDIIQNCRGYRLRARTAARIAASRQRAGSIRAAKVGLAVAGNSSRVASDGRACAADRKPCACRPSCPRR